VALAFAPCEVSANSQAFRLWKCFHNKKNWLFSQTPKGAHASARLYSLIETAKANGIEPYTYMVEVLTKRNRSFYDVMDLLHVTKRPE
jgi:hypothetical protein